MFDPSAIAVTPDVEEKPETQYQTVIRLARDGLTIPQIALEIDRDEEQVRASIKRARDRGQLPQLDGPPRPKPRILSAAETEAILNDWIGDLSLSLDALTKKYAMSVARIEGVVERARRADDPRAISRPERSARIAAALAPPPPPAPRLSDELGIKIAKVVEVEVLARNGQPARTNRISLSGGLNYSRELSLIEPLDVST